VQEKDDQCRARNCLLLRKVRYISRVGPDLAGDNPASDLDPDPALDPDLNPDK
jgi:hypothetical protein